MSEKRIFFDPILKPLYFVDLKWSYNSMCFLLGYQQDQLTVDYLEWIYLKTVICVQEKIVLTKNKTRVEKTFVWIKSSGALQSVKIGTLIGFFYPKQKMYEL